MFADSIFSDSGAIFLVIAAVTVCWLLLGGKTSVASKLEPTSQKQRFVKRQKTASRTGWLAGAFKYGPRASAPAAPEPEAGSNANAEQQEPSSMFERDKKKDLARPLMERLDNSLFEKDKEDDLTRPFNYGNDLRNTMDLFELDKKDDLTRDW